MKQKHFTEELPERLKTSSLFEQVNEDSLVEWLKHVLKRDKALRIEFLTRFAVEIETRDIHTKYMHHCREIRRFYGKNIDSDKKLKGKKMYILYERLLTSARDQIALDNFLEAYEIVHAVHANLFPSYRQDMLNARGMACLKSCYELMNYLSNEDLPPPLVSIVSEDWKAILESGNFEIFHTDYNPFGLLFKVFEDEEYLFNYFRSQLQNKSYSQEAFKALKLVFTYAYILDLSSDRLNEYIQDMHPLQFKRILSEITAEKKQSLQRYILDHVSVENHSRLDRILVEHQYHYHKEHGNTSDAWAYLMEFIETDLNDKTINLLLDFIKENLTELTEEQITHLRKLEKKLPKEDRWMLMQVMGRKEELIDAVFNESEIMDTIPYIEEFKKGNQRRIVRHYSEKLTEYLEVYHGRKSIQYLHDFMQELRRHGHRDLSYSLLKSLEEMYPNRPSIKNYLSGKYI